MKRLSPRCNGFTLIEVMLTGFILALSATAAYAVLRTQFREVRAARDEFIADERWLRLCDQLSAAWRSAGGDVDAPLPFFAHPSPEGFSLTTSGAEQRTYETRRAGHGIELLEILDGRRRVLADDISSAEADFFDGREWQRSWNWNAAEARPFSGIRGAPALIRLRVSFSEGPAPSAPLVVPVMTAWLNGGGNE